MCPYEDINLPRPRSFIEVYTKTYYKSHECPSVFFLLYESPIHQTASLMFIPSLFTPALPLSFYGDPCIIGLDFLTM